MDHSVRRRTVARRLVVVDGANAGRVNEAQATPQEGRRHLDLGGQDALLVAWVAALGDQLRQA
jgi:hypothetical protein